MDEADVIETARAVQNAAAAAGVAIERLIVIDGMAEHECDDRRWQERTRRMHISLVRARTRALLDLGSFDLNDVVRVAGALARLDDVEREAPPRLRLAPNVAAALLPSLIGIAPPNVRLLQTAGGVDGCGETIVETSSSACLGSSELLGGPNRETPRNSEELRGTRGPGAWPNWYRPSYRVRPVRMPLQLRLECDVTTIDADRARAVALLAPVSIINSELVLRVLIDDGDRAFPSTVRVARIDAVSNERTWYPYGGGSFGAEMML
jgi:hypothetical protein